MLTETDVKRLARLILANESATAYLTGDVSDLPLAFFSTLAVYADNAAAKAGGLVDGQLYRTATGQVMVAYT